VSKVRTIAAWTTQFPVGLIGGNEEIAIRTFHGDVAWLPEQLGLSVAASRTYPRWAIGRGNRLVIFELEGTLPTLQGRVSVYGSEMTEKRVDLMDLFEAISSGDLVTVKRLLAIQPDLACSSDSQGLTPLHKLAQQPMVEEAQRIALALVNGGADPNARDVSGVTPLHWLSCRPRGIGVAEVLLERGADPLAESFQGETPLDSALRMSFMVGDQMMNLLNRYVRNR